MIPRGDRLKASNENPFVSITTGEEAAPATGFETQEESAELTLKSTTTTVVKIPMNSQFEVLPIGESGNEVSLPEMSQEEFTQKETLKSWQSQLTETSAEVTEETKQTEETTTSSEIPKVELVPYLQVDIGNGNKDLYLKLEANQGQKIRVTKHTEEGIELFVQEAFAPENQQTLMKFVKNEPIDANPVVPEATPENPSEETEGENQEAVIPEETEGTALPEEEMDEGVSGDSLLESRAVSKDTPFKVTVDVGKETGIAPFDTKSGDGYDSGKDNDLVRTFDAVQYTINYGIPVSSDYESLEVRLDTVLPNAWRKDSSGKLRQTAEITNGTVTTEANGSKTSKHSVTTTLAGTGQGWFTENVDTYGGLMVT